MLTLCPYFIILFLSLITSSTNIDCWTLSLTVVAFTSLFRENYSAYLVLHILLVQLITLKLIVKLRSLIIQLKRIYVTSRVLQSGWIGLLGLKILTTLDLILPSKVLPTIWYMDVLLHIFFLIALSYLDWRQRILISRMALQVWMKTYPSSPSTRLDETPLWFCQF